MQGHLAAIAEAIKTHDPVLAISNLCLSKDVSDGHIEDAKAMLGFNQCGWLDTPEQRMQTQRMCALVRMEWDSATGQKPATAAARLLEKGLWDEAELLLGFAAEKGRAPLLIRLLEAMLRARHDLPDDVQQYMFGAQ